MPLSDYPDLGFGESFPEKDPAFVLMDTSSFENFGKEPVFSMSPSIVHFGGFVVGKDQHQTLSVVNCSPNSIRMLILPTETPFFKVISLFVL